MRAVLVIGLVGCIAGCPQPGEPLPPDGPLLYPPVMDPNPGHDGCHSDAACNVGEVCARVGGCMAADLVYAVHVTWTLSGQPANATTCAASPDLTIYFTDGPSYAPVPCRQGKFTIDKLPRRITEVGLSANGDHRGMAALDPETGDAAIDLPL